MRRPPILASILLLAAPIAALAQEADFTIRLHYVTRDYEEPLPLSLLEEPIPDEGVMGARLANQENQLTGRFMGFDFVLEEHILPLDAPFPDAARPAISEGAGFVIADLEAADLLALADMPDARDDVLLSTRAHDDDLRLTQCRKNVFHVAPSWQMKADGLAQYLVWKRWKNWFVLSGTKVSDRFYSAALERAAEKFGATIVERREYQWEVGSRRVESGHQQIQTQMPQATQGAADHDVIVVADVEEAFGEYLLYRTWEPVPVVGTHGLVSEAWHRSFEQFGSMSLHSAFEKLADRPIEARDYLNWLAVKTVAEPAIRLKTADPAAITAEWISPDFKQPGFKGIGLNFRTWNQQMRQPMLIAWERALVSMSPQEEFLHQRHMLDSLGWDKSESECRLNKGD